LPVVPAKPTAKALYQIRHGTPYRGRMRDKSLEGKSVLGLPQNWQQPFEDPEDGCPGAWYRTYYIDSVDAYVRRRTSTGNRVPNPLFDVAPIQVQVAVLYLEEQQEMARAAFEEAVAERMRAQMTQSTATSGARSGRLPRR
jgi:hypothetical protein